MFSKKNVNLPKFSKYSETPKTLTKITEKP